MPDIAGHPSANRLPDLMERLPGQFAPDLPKSLTGALLSLLTAMDYNDPVLIRSAVEAGMRGWADVIDEAVAKCVGWPPKAREICREIWAEVRQAPCENFDDMGNKVATFFDQMLQALSDLRNGPVKVMMDHGFEIRHVAVLDNDIKEIQLLKKETLDSWPWSGAELPPVNRAMAAKSMAAIARGEKGERIEDLIRRLDGSQ